MSPDTPPGANPGRTHRLPARLLAWTVCAVFFFCLFVSLGTWQVQRHFWKQTLIERVNARVNDQPLAPPGPDTWPTLDNGTIEYRPVRLSGQFDHSKQALVQASTTLGAGFWVLTPLRTAEGWWVWVNRGYAPPARQANGQQVDPVGPVELTGLMRLPEPKGGFLRTNDAASDRWFSRDVQALSTARALAGGSVAPYFVDASVNPTAKPGQWPVGGLTVIRFANNHLAYIFTWYALAAMVLVAFAFVWRHEHQTDAQSAGSDSD